MNPIPRAFVLTVAFLASSLSLAPCHAQEAEFQYPATKLGARTRALVAAMNDGSDDVLLAFSREHRSAESIEAMSHARMKDALQQMMRSVGKLTPKSIVTDEPLELVILVALGDGSAWANLRATTADENAAKLAGFTLIPTAGPDREPITLGDWESLDDLLESARAASRAPAIAVAVVAADEIAATAAVGKRVSGEAAEVTARDRFHIGSVTKSMTATVIGALVDAGQIGFETKVSDHVANSHADWAEVTVAQLLRHRGGMPAYTSIDDEGLAALKALAGSPRQQRAEFASQLLSVAPDYEPGAEFRYSNAGYSVLAHLAEEVADKSWEDLVRRHVFVPARMKRVGFGWPATKSRPNQPRGHRMGGQPQPLDDEYHLTPALAPAGDVHCSVADLARYARMHLRGLAQQPGALRHATFAQLHAVSEGDYACGWLLRDDGSCHWHNGSAGTFYALVALYPKRERAVVFVANSAGQAVSETAWAVVDAIEKRKLGAR